MVPRTVTPFRPFPTYKPTNFPRLLNAALISLTSRRFLSFLQLQFNYFLALDSNLPWEETALTVCTMIFKSQQPDINRKS
jgi:hypothetical protein